MASREDRPRLPEFADAAPVQPNAALRSRVLATVGSTLPFEGFVARFARLFDVDEARGREILRSATDPASGAWVDVPVVPGMRLLHFQGGARVAGADCGFVRLEPGTEFPLHRHLGTEWTLVLAGGAEEAGGAIWLPGDLVVKEAETVHAYRALDDEPFLFAVVLHEGIEPAEA